MNIHVLSIIVLCLLLWNKLQSLERVLISSLITMFLVILIFRPSQYSVYNCIVAVWISYIFTWMHQNFPYIVYWILRKNLYHDYNVVMSNRLLFSSHHLLSIIFFFLEKIFWVVECMLSCLMEHYGVLPKKYDELKHFVFWSSMTWFRDIDLTI